MSHGQDMRSNERTDPKTVPSLLAMALLHSLRRWQTSNATLGGQSARGHGRLALSLHLDGAESVADSAVAQYVEHVEASREEGSAWLGGDLEA